MTVYEAAIEQARAERHSPAPDMAKLTHVIDDVLDAMRAERQESNRRRATIGELRQLVSEAVALLDENDPDHENVDLPAWLRSAKSIIIKGRLWP